MHPYAQSKAINLHRAYLCTKKFLGTKKQANSAHKTHGNGFFAGDDRLVLRQYFCRNSAKCLMCKQIKALFWRCAYGKRMLKKAAGQKVLEEQSALLHCPDKQNVKIYEEYS